MPVDPNIILSYRPPEFPSPLESYGRAMTLRNMGQQAAQQAQLNQQRLQQGEANLRMLGLQEQDFMEKQNRARQVREVFATEPDQAKALEKIYAIDPAAGQALSDHLNKRQKEQREQQQQEFEFGQKIQTAIGNELAGIITEPDRTKWPDLYKAARARLTIDPTFTQNPRGKALLANIPEQMPPEEQLLAQARQNPQTAQVLENVLKSQQEAKERKQFNGRTAKEQDDLDYRKLQLETQRQNAEATREATAEYRITQADLAEERNSIARDRLEKDKGQKDQTARLDRLQREFDKFDADEQKWHGERQRLGDALAANDGESVIWKGRVQPMDTTLRKSIQTEFDHATSETKRLYDLKLRKMAEMGKGPDSAPPQPIPASTPKPAAQAPDSQYRIGQVVIWQGKRHKIIGFSAEGKVQAQPVE